MSGRALVYGRWHGRSKIVLTGSITIRGGVLVCIAPRGQAAVGVARKAEAEVEAEWTRHLGKHGTAQLRRALTRLREITDPYG
jgi:hypothetical protein